MDIRSELIKEAAGLLDSRAATRIRELADGRKVLSARKVLWFLDGIEREHCEAATRLKKIADDDVMKKLENATLLVRRLARAMPDSLLKKQAMHDARAAGRNPVGPGVDTNMRRMSFSMTIEQFLDGTKDVTRR